MRSGAGLATGALTFSATVCVVRVVVWTGAEADVALVVLRTGAGVVVLAVVVLTAATFCVAAGCCVLAR